MTRPDYWFKLIWQSFIVMIVFVVIFFLTDSLVGTSYQTNYLPEVVGVLVGVFLALSLSQWELAKSNQTRIDAMKKILQKELERMQEAVDAHKGNYLETQVWTSFVNSGDAALLPVDLQEQLFEIYAEARALNIETARVRDAAEAFRRSPSNETRKAHIQLSIRISEKELDLSNRLRKFFHSHVLNDP